MKVNVRFDSEGNLWIDELSLDRRRLSAALCFLRARGLLIPLRREARRVLPPSAVVAAPAAPESESARAGREVVITVGRAQRVGS